MRTKTGIITSAKMQNTVTVTVHRYVMHAMYAKRFRVTKKFLADTNGHQLGVGDEVTITECRPLSKRKCFKVTEIRKKAVQLADMKHDEHDDVQHDHRSGMKKKDSTPAK
jgi:small subunit ribosomal protein S17